MLPLLLSLSALAQPPTPLAQRLELTIDPAAERYTGLTEIDVLIDEKGTRIELFANDMNISSATATLGKKRVPMTAEFADGGQLVLTSSKPLKPAVWTLELVFDNDLHSKPYGIYSFTHEGDAYVVSQFEADDAREAFPCFDEPSSKIPWSVTLTVPTGLTAVTNAAEDSMTSAGEWDTHFFRDMPPTPSYALAFAIGPYEHQDITGTPIESRVYTVKGKAELATSIAIPTDSTLRALQDWFGEDYPYEKLDYIAVPEFAFGGMENPGAIVLADWLLGDPTTMTTRRRGFVSHVVAHELAHMWFGDMVTMSWWDDLWLNESFAEWLATEIVEDLSPELDKDFARVHSTHRALFSDGTVTMLPIRTEVDPAHVFETANFIAYPKGQAVLEMVQEDAVGREAFQAGVRSYIDKHRWGNAKSSDLFAAIQEASGQDVGAMLRPYLDEPGGPFIELAVDGDQLTLTQKRYAQLGSEVQTTLAWTVPMHVQYADGSGKVKTQSIVFSESTQTVKLEAEGDIQWLYPTRNGVGYYVWKVDDDMLARLMEAAPNTLTPIERVALVGNLDLLVKAGDYEAGQMLGLLNALSSDTDPHVIKEVADFQDYAGDLRSDELDPEWAVYVRQTRGPWLDAIGFERADDDSEAVVKLRRNLIQSLAEDGEDERVLEYLDEVATDFLEKRDSVDPEIAGIAMNMRARHAELGFQANMFKLYEAEKTPRYKDILAYAAAEVRAEGGQLAAIEYATTAELDSGEALSILFTALNHDEDSDFGLDWSIEHHDWFLEKLAPQHHPRLVGLGAGCDAERFERAAEFYGAPERKVAGTDRAIGEARERTLGCVERKKQHGPGVDEYLRQTTTSAATEPSAQTPQPE